jgi:hypothetical protein
MKSFNDFYSVLPGVVAAGLIFSQLGCSDRCKVDTECTPGEICVDGKCEKGTRGETGQDSDIATAFERPTSATTDPPAARDTEPSPESDTSSDTVSAVDEEGDTQAPSDMDVDAGVDASLDAGGDTAGDDTSGGDTETETIVPDECLVCHQFADCVPSETGFTCVCQHGFDGDGIVACNDVDECAAKPDRCGPRIGCSNTLGSYECPCAEGFHYEGFDVCAADTPDCTTDILGECLAIEIRSISLTASRVRPGDILLISVEVYHEAGVDSITSVTVDHVENLLDEPVSLTRGADLDANTAVFEYSIPLVYDRTDFVNLAVRAEDSDGRADTDATHFLFVTGNIIDVGPSQPYATIQEGIDAASNEDLVLVHQGVYSGEGNTNLTTTLDRLHIDSSEGPDSTVIDLMNGDAPAFAFPLIDREKSISVRGLTITNGQGGAVFLEAFGLEVAFHASFYNMIFSNNAISDAGGDIPGGSVFRANGKFVTVSVRNSDFTDNSDSAIWGENGINYLIEKCRFTGNSGASSGAIYLVTNDVSDGRDISSVEIVDCYFEDNTSTANGAGAITAQGLSIDGSRFVNNVGAVTGAVYSNLSHDSPVYSEISASSFEENSPSPRNPDGVGRGGAIVSNEIAVLMVEDSVFKRNT